MGEDAHNDETGKPMLSLKDAADLLLPKTDTIRQLRDRSHTAGADAQLHRLLYIALRALVGRAQSL